MAGGFETGALARDTVFAAVMLILNGIVGLCLLLALLYGIALIVRRRLLARHGGTFELSYRARAEHPGRGWLVVSSQGSDSFAVYDIRPPFAQRGTFAIGTKAPAVGSRDEQFKITWTGSLLVPDTGEYDFRVTTPNGVRVYVNAPANGSEKNALIDIWVSSAMTRTAAS